MIWAAGDMCAYHGHRVAVAVPGLDLGTAERICIIARPDLWEITEHTKVKTVSTRSTALKQDVRESLCQLPHAAVKSHHIPVCHLPLPFRTDTL